MRKLKLYIETSTWNFVFAEDSPEKMAITKDFFNLMRQGIYDTYVSDIVFLEIERAPEAMRSKLSKLINEYAPKQIPSSPDAQNLAKQYLFKKIVPANKREDALHIAIATVEELDAVITWNYRHMANLRKAELFYSVNVEMGYHKRLEIITPMEVSRYDER